MSHYFHFELTIWFLLNVKIFVLAWKPMCLSLLATSVFVCLQEICSKAITADGYNDQERALQREATGLPWRIEPHSQLHCRAFNCTGPRQQRGPIYLYSGIPLQLVLLRGSTTPAVIEVDEATVQPSATRYAGILATWRLRSSIKDWANYKPLMEFFFLLLLYTQGLRGGVRDMLHPMHVLHMYLYSLIYAHYVWAQLQPLSSAYIEPSMHQCYKRWVTTMSWFYQLHFDVSTQLQCKLAYQSGWPCSGKIAC